MALEKQMELFDDGGLLQEGNTVDPESGNDVPVGSTQEEVRDDIPAQLSEGEFVLPADVVRFHGLEKIMALRDEAKAGLQKMDAMGQMGNSEEATLDDDVPFSLEDLDMEDDGVLDYNVGGVVQQQGTGIGGYQPSQFANYVPAQAPAPVYNVPIAYTPPTQAAVPTMAAPTAQKPAPTFDTLFKGKAPTSGELDNREYINPETGEKRVFTFIGGTSSVPIPTGFIPLSQYKPEEAVVKPSATTVGTTTTQQQDDEPTPDDGMGPGAGRVVLGGKNVDGLRQDGTQAGVSFSGLGIGNSGIVGSIGLAMGKEIPADATATFTRNNVTVNITGEEYNDIKKDNFVGATATAIARSLDVRSLAKSNKLNIDETTGSIKDEQGNEVDNDTISRIGRTVYNNVKSTSLKDLKSAGQKLSTQEKAIVQKYNDAMFEDYFEDDDSNDSGSSSSSSSTNVSGVNVGSSSPSTSAESGYGSYGGSLGGGYSSQATGDKTSGRTGFNKGGDVTKQMKQSGLASKK